jgi:GLPGLI family protein
MRKLVLAIGSLFGLISVHAQQGNNGFLLSGDVIYEEVVKMDIQLDGVDEQIAAQIPKERKSQKILHFNEEVAVFENHQTESPEDNMPHEGGGIMIKMQSPDNKTYIDLAKLKVVEQKEFMTRVFLIESDLEAQKWKISGKQKKILDYACMEAIREVDGEEVRVWFTPQIAVSAGPGKYSDLPGLVLAAEKHNGDARWEALSVDLKPLDKEVLKKPGKGKKVSQEEYLAIVAEKMKEMGMEGEGTWKNDGGGEHTSTVVIRIQQ